MLHVPYNGIAQIVPELTAGRIDVAFLDLAFAQRVADKVRNLAILDPGKSSLAPELPSIQDTFPEFRRAQIWFGLFGPAGLDKGVLETLHGALRKALAEPEARAFFAKSFLHLVASSPRELEDSIAADRALTSDVIAKIGLTAD
jgi:tripartite-type tricarboxylate transporter receptor subunit TctC